MKKLLPFLSLLVALQTMAQTPIPVVRNNGTVTAVDVRLHTKALKIPVYIDTAHALAAAGVDSIGLIFKESGSNKVWYRDSTYTSALHMWVLFGSGGGSSGNPNSNIGSGYRLAIPNTNNVKTIFGAFGVKFDSTTNANALTAFLDTGYVATQTALGDTAANLRLISDTVSVHRLGQPGDSLVIGAGNVINTPAIRDSGVLHHYINPDGSWTLFSPTVAGGVSISSPNNTLIVGGTSSAPTLDFNLSNPNLWAATQTLNGVSLLFNTNGVSLIGNSTNNALSVNSHQFISNGSWTAAATGGSNNMLFNVNAATRLTLQTTGQAQLNSYGLGTFTGTAAYYLAVTSAGQVIESSGSGGGGSPGGSTTQVQYNSGGSFAGSANMTFNGTALTLANDASVAGQTLGIGAGGDVHNAVFAVTGLHVNTTGDFNVSIGHSALYANTTGNGNVAIDYLALSSNTAGSYNVAIGYEACRSCTGSYNVAIGGQALSNYGSGNDNTAVGGLSQINSTGYLNTSLGKWAASLLTTGSYNTALGGGALSGDSTGIYNTAVGALNLDLPATGSYLTSVGAYGMQQQNHPMADISIGDQIHMWATTYSDTGMIMIGHHLLGGSTQLYNSKSSILISADLGYAQPAHWYGDIAEGDSINVAASDTLVNNVTVVARKLTLPTTSGLTSQNLAIFGTASQLTMFNYGGVNTAGMLALPQLAQGWVWNTDSLAYCYFDGTAWHKAGGSTGGGGMTNPMTTAGDIIYGGTSGTPTRLAGGTSTYVLTSNGPTSAPSWQAASGGGGMTNPMTTSQDIIVGGTSGTPTRLAVGSDGQFLMNNAGTLGYYSLAVSVGSANSNGGAFSANLLSLAPAAATTPGVIAASGAQTLGATLTITHDMTIDGLTVGIGAGTGTQNTALGSGAGHTAAAWGNGTFVGFDAGFNENGTTTVNNTAVGATSMQNINGVGINNTAVGFATMKNNYTGVQNTVMGASADFGSGSGGFASSGVSAFGYLALTVNQGNNNTALGTSVLQTNSTGFNNLGFGYGVLANETTGSYNLAAGYNTFNTLTSGTYNIGIGPWVDVPSATTSNYGSFDNVLIFRGLPSLTSLSSTPVVGQMGIGIDPNSIPGTLVLAAGTAGQAPLILTPGSNLTTPQNGALENDGAFLYITEGGVRQKLNGNSTLFSQTANGTALVNTALGATITNSTGATGVVGSPNVPGTYIVPGAVFTLHGFLVLSTASSPGSLTLNGTVGGAPVQLIFTPPASLTNAICEFTITVAVQSIVSTTVSVTEEFRLDISGNSPLLAKSATTITSFSTSTSYQHDLQATWTVASTSNSIQTIPEVTLKVK